MARTGSPQNGLKRTKTAKVALQETSDVPMNRSLHAAKAAKQDEFYTQYDDIQKEVEAYLELDPETFRGKVVYCNCDDPFESNFFKYFAANFNKLGLKKLVTTSYDGSPIAGQLSLFPEYDEGNGKRKKPKGLAVVLDRVKDEDGDGAANLEDVKLFLKRNKAARKGLKGDDRYPGGDFRSAECVAFLKEADIVVTNPPFSLFREYVAQLVEHGKKFLIIGNMQATTYNEIFPLIKADKLWMGVTIHSGDREFRVPDHYPLNASGWRVDENGVKYIRIKGVRWWTNLDHGRRHEKLPLMTIKDNLRYSKHKEIKGKAAYDRYDNYDAIEVPYTDAIPSDYDGVMGVPITFLDKYNPEQFEILGLSGEPDYPMTKKYGKKERVVDGVRVKSNTGTLRAVIRTESFGPGTHFDVGYPVRGVYRQIFIRHRNKCAKGRKK
jgi:hypothetical protein